MSKSITVKTGDSPTLPLESTKNAPHGAFFFAILLICLLSYAFSVYAAITR